MAHAWFSFASNRDKVSLEGIEDVDDLRDAIKPIMTPKLDEYAAADLIIRAALIDDKVGSQAAVLDAEDTLQQYELSFTRPRLPANQLIGNWII